MREGGGAGKSKDGEDKKCAQDKKCANGGCTHFPNPNPNPSVYSSALIKSVLVGGAHYSKPRP